MKQDDKHIGDFIFKPFENQPKLFTIGINPKLLFSNVPFDEMNEILRKDYIYSKRLGFWCFSIPH